METNTNMLNVKTKILSETARLPSYGSDYAACCDLYADVKYIKGAEDGKLYIAPGGTLMVPTGLSFEPPAGYCGLIFARSGLSTKKGLRPANCVGVCDEDYRGNYKVAIHNDSDEMQVIEHGDRIAQLMFVPYTRASFEVVDALSDTSRGDGGFGSSGR